MKDICSVNQSTGHIFPWTLMQNWVFPVIAEDDICDMNKTPFQVCGRNRGKISLAIRQWQIFMDSPIEHIPMTTTMTSVVTFLGISPSLWIILYWQTTVGFVYCICNVNIPSVKLLRYFYPNQLHANYTLLKCKITDKIFVNKRIYFFRNNKDGTKGNHAN